VIHIYTALWRNKRNTFLLHIESDCKRKEIGEKINNIFPFYISFYSFASRPLYKRNESKERDRVAI
jgi:hypothetical protein